MLSTEIIFNSLKSPYVEKLEDIKESYCMFCFKNINQGVHYKKILSSSFTNYDSLKNLGGKYICKECSCCIKESLLRKNNFIADPNNIYLLKKNDLENYLFNLDKYVQAPFVIGITQSFKKHNSFRCRVNYSTKEYFIRMEDLEIVFNVGKFKSIYDMLNEAYLYFSKDELESGVYNTLGVEQFGIGRFENYEDEFKKHRGSQYFKFLIYIMNSERRNEIIKDRRKR